MYNGLTTQAARRYAELTESRPHDPQKSSRRRERSHRLPPTGAEARSGTSPLRRRPVGVPPVQRLRSALRGRRTARAVDGRPAVSSDSHLTAIFRFFPTSSPTASPPASGAHAIAKAGSGPACPPRAPQFEARRKMRKEPISCPQPQENAASYTLQNEPMEAPLYARAILKLPCKTSFGFVVRESTT